MRVNNKQNIIKFYDEMASEWGFESSSGIIVTLGNFNEHVGKYVEGFEAVHGGNGIGKKVQKEKTSEGDREDWFEEGGCPESRQVQRRECEHLQKEWGESGHLC